MTKNQAIQQQQSPNLRFKTILKDCLKPVSTDEIHTWARKNVILKFGYADNGPFDVNKSRHLIEPFRAVKDRNTREVVCSAAIQMGKTLLTEISILWYLSHKNIPILFTQATQDMIKDEVNNRLYPLMKNCRQLRAIIPEKDKNFTNTGIMFPHCTLYVASGKDSAFAARSIGFLCCDEIWQYDQGMLAKAMGRVTAFDQQKKSKILLVSQPKDKDDDFDIEYRKGTQEEWCVPCLGCGEYLFPEWRPQLKDGTYRGMIWDSNEVTKPSGSWCLPEVYKTIRYECIHCGHKHTDSPELKKEWNSRGKYIARNTNADPSVRSFRWNSIVSRDWKLLVEEFLQAKELSDVGIQTTLLDFFRSRMTQPYDSNYYGELGHLKTDVYEVHSDWADEVSRFMTIDCQKMHFWVEIRAWAADGRSRQLYFGKCLNDDILQLREKFNIPPNHVFVDVGNTEYQEDTGKHLVYEFVDKYRYIGLKGDAHGEKDGYIHNIRGKQTKRWWKYPQRIPNSRNNSVFICFAPDQCRNILKELRDDKTGKFISLDNQEYKRHMFAEKKKPKPSSKYGGGFVWRWERIGSLPNHGWDCSVMQVVAALIDNKIMLIPNLSINPDSQQS